MSRLIKLNSIEDTEIINSILEDDLLIYEKVKGTKVYVRWDGDKFEIRPRTITSEPINLIDLSMQKYYEGIFKFFENLPKSKKSMLDKKWFFGFHYFPGDDPESFGYNIMPKNGLVLTSIQKNKKFRYTYEDLQEYARLFDVDVLPVIYQGRLSERNKQAIYHFLKTSKKDVEYVFGEKTFSFFFYKLLNPSKKHSFLSNDFNPNIEQLVIKSSFGETSFSILNPLYEREEETANTEYVEIYTMILLNFAAFISGIDLSKIHLISDTREEAYLEMVCNLYNQYVYETKEQLLNFDIAIPDFFNKPVFQVNADLIKNKKTKSYLENDKLAYIFKAIVGSYRKPKKGVVGIFTETTLDTFNNTVVALNKQIDGHLKRGTEIDLFRSNLISPVAQIDFTYDTDGEGKTYQNKSDVAGSRTTQKDKKKPLEN